MKKEHGGGVVNENNFILYQSQCDVSNVEKIESLIFYWTFLKFNYLYLHTSQYVLLIFDVVYKCDIEQNRYWISKKLSKSQTYIENPNHDEVRYSD